MNLPIIVNTNFKNRPTDFLFVGRFTIYIELSKMQRYGLNKARKHFCSGACFFVHKQEKRKLNTFY